jgi:hypothetical protein
MKRPPRRKSHPTRIGGIVEQVLAEAGLLTAVREQQAGQEWPTYAGERIAAVTECVSVERGVLHIRVKSAAWRNELIYIKPMLLSRARQVCGTITDIIFS